MTRGHVKQLVIIAVAAIAATFALAACGSTSQTASTTQAASSTAAASTAAATEVKVASLKGPTSIGLVSFMDRAKNGKTANTYDFTISGTADEIVPSLVSGDIDIACIPANVASVVYNKTNGGISVIDINTLGVLSVVTGDTSVTSFADLAGHTVYMTGKGQTPEFVMNYLLEKAGLTNSVTLEYKSEASEVAAALAQDANAVGVLPEPYVTAVCAKNSALSAPISLTSVWDQMAGDSGSKLVTGVTVVRNEFLQAHPDVVAEFMSEQKASVDAVNADPSGSAQLVVDAGIVDNATVAAKAIPNCNLTYITGVDMQTALSGYYQVLYLADPTSIGGTLPPDNYYYLG